MKHVAWIKYNLNLQNKASKIPFEFHYNLTISNIPDIRNGYVRVKVKN